MESIIKYKWLNLFVNEVAINRTRAMSGEMPDRIHMLVTALGVEVVGRRNDSILGIDDPGSSHSRVMLSSPDYER